MGELQKTQPGRFNDEVGIKPAKVDAKDKKILVLLAEDGRMAVSEIAKQVRLSRDGVSYRINRLINEGVIKKFFPVINLRKLGYNTFHVFMLLDELEKPLQAKLIQDMINHPNTKAVREYSDSWDIELVFIAKTLREMDEILMEITTNYPRMILAKENLQIIKGYNSASLPYCMYGNMKKSFEWKEPGQIIQYSLDEKDWKILEMLSIDCRSSTYEIGKKVGLSPDAVAYRIKKMKDANIIRKFTILADLTKLGFHWYNYAMRVKTFNKQYDAKMKEFVRSHPNIIRAIKTLGGWDFVMHILTEDPASYHKAIKDIKTAFSSVIKEYQTWFGYKEYYYDIFPRIIMEKHDEKKNKK
jgi:Lrp/AsnC family leucine-responsive transcriptional regulator